MNINYFKVGDRVKIIDLYSTPISLDECRLLSGLYGTVICIVEAPLIEHTVQVQFQSDIRLNSRITTDRLYFNPLNLKHV